jgi:hypothetical protein
MKKENLKSEAATEINFQSGTIQKNGKEYYELILLNAIGKVVYVCDCLNTDEAINYICHPKIKYLRS